MSVVDNIKAFVPFLRGPQRLPPDLLRSLHPVHSPVAAWGREGDPETVVITMPRPPTQGWKAAIAKFVGESPGRRYEISDEIGAAVWELCDGEHTVRDICREIGDRYSIGQRQTEVSVLQFLNMLLTRRMIGIPPNEQALVNLATGKAKLRKTDPTAGRESDGNDNSRPKPARAKHKRRY